MTGTEIYKRTPTYEAEARSIRIHAPQWKLLLAYDGQRTLSEVALSAEMAYAEAVPLTQTFLENKWIAEEPITLDQYLKRLGAKDITATGAVVAPPVVLHDPEKDKPKPSAPPAPLPVTPPPVAAQPPATPPRPVPVPIPLPVPVPVPVSASAPKPVSAPTPVTPPPLPATPVTTPIPLSALPMPDKPAAKRTMKLSAVVDYITSLVGNVSLGQILVYRVFLRVPPELLLAEDIASVHLSGDASLINGEKLQKAIADAVNAVAKKGLPDSVYA